ncbi:MULTISPECIES: HAD family hydrolase [unclassified Streptomyces]|uniref:HAD family hydrolase n=1 Tax=unclassified Streptomyces TaxID=2593676 RepID=UPI000DADC645|nr:MULTISPECIES: HAD family hydrolase [unclassified Streptomyces]PZT72062.1 HAD family hydrolase [Streptomyces sp. AC1-42T]PZT81615.1 HAD family hydrolase [Streptomyces sp. AC1-42W]
MGIAPGDHRTHLVWDWNGTLLDDNTAVVGATNAAFGEVGLAPITVEQYREMYCIPIPRFYERLMGRLPTDAEWERMDGVFHRSYTQQRGACGLTAGAADLLAQWQLTGRSQSIMSMYRHDELLPVVRGFGIERHFVRVDGRTGPSGGSKAQYMARHLAALEGISPRHTVVIGDAVDDAVAAAHVGARAVLYTGGSHSRASLEKAGVPVVDTLVEATALAEQLTR